MDTFLNLWREFLSLTEFIPIDLVLVLAIAFMFGRFVWVMQHRTRIWDNLSRSLMAVFVSICLVFLYLGVTRVTDPFYGQEVLLWTIRLFVLVAITWSQFELNKELKKVPNILFVRDRNWVRRRISNVEIIRALLMSHSTTPPEIIEAIDAELEEMYRFKEVVWEEDQRHGHFYEPEWTHNPWYVEKHELEKPDPFETESERAEAEEEIHDNPGGLHTTLQHGSAATPGDSYEGEGGNQ